MYNDPNSDIWCHHQTLNQYYLCLYLASRQLATLLIILLAYTEDQYFTSSDIFVRLSDIFDIIF